MPVWGLLMAITIAAIYIIPGGYIYGMTATPVRQLLCLGSAETNNRVSDYGQHRRRDDTGLSAAWQSGPQHGVFVLWFSRPVRARR
jgi:hypothetical protein